MKKALDLWKRLELPPLQLKAPWYGYALGHCEQEFSGMASVAVEYENLVEARENFIEIPKKQGAGTDSTNPASPFPQKTSLSSS